MWEELKIWIKSIGDTIFPRFCCVCGKRLLLDEQFTCTECLCHLPLTHLKGKRGNVVERLFWDDVFQAQRANSFMYYQAESTYSRIFFHFKYGKRPDLSVAYGRLMAQELLSTTFFENIDLLIPIPLSPKREKKRGYNQSERLAQGVSEITNIKVEENAIARIKDNPTQTHLQKEEREKNVKGIFTLTHPQLIENKHLLIIDDVITTGSTIRSCAHTLMQAKNVKISILSLGISQWHREIPYPTDIRHGFA